MENKSTRPFLIITSIFLLVVGLISVVPAMMSFMMFDAPGSEKNPTTIILFCSVLTFPAACLLAIVLSWILYACQRQRTACWAAFLPIANLIVAAIALVWLEVFNHGFFS